MGMILVTGQPGHGKTAWAIDHCFKLKNEEGREIYAHGIKDFDYERAGFKYLEDPTKWQDLPDGSVVLLDECYTVFPNRNPGAKVPDHVEAMARHRHRGFDFVLIAQQGLQLDPFLRGLYEQHIHVRQTSFIKNKTNLKRWNEYQGNVKAASNDSVDWLRPKYVFDYYTSTTKITTKRHMPMWMRWLIAGVVFLLLVLYGIKTYYGSKIAGFEQEQQAKHQTKAGPGAADFEAASGAATRAFATPGDYAMAHLPRFATMPWTAPIFDQRQPVAQPELMCMSSREGRDADGKHSNGGCTCLTEQSTRYDISTAECRRLAVHGAIYNPYKQPAMQQAAAPMPVEAAPQPRLQSERPPVAAGSDAGLELARYGSMRGKQWPAVLHGQ